MQVIDHSSTHLKLLTIQNFHSTSANTRPRYRPTLSFAVRMWTLGKVSGIRCQVSERAASRQLSAKVANSEVRGILKSRIRLQVSERSCEKSCQAAAPSPEEAGRERCAFPDTRYLRPDT